MCGYFRDRGVQDPQERYQLFKRAIILVTIPCKANLSSVDFLDARLFLCGWPGQT